jgi:uncharacterized membrane protein
MQTNPKKEKSIYRLFRISVILKGVHALLELIGGFILLFLSTKAMSSFVTSLTQDELSEDPHDVIAHYLYGAGQHLSVGAKHFGGLYLLSHGVVNMALVVGLLKNRPWAYPTSLAILSLFIGYQIYRFTHTHSVGLIALTLFDLLVLGLIWREYGIIRRRQVFDSISGQ